MFVNTQMGGLNFGFPDVCLTPIVVPVPIPYPNLATGVLAMPPTAALNVLITCMPTHTIATMGTISFGDQPGIELGVLSGLFMGPHHTLIPSFTMLSEGMPTSHLCSMTAHNGFSLNAPGLSIVPSQFNTLCLMP
jgi:hypothetical protein